MSIKNPYMHGKNHKSELVAVKQRKPKGLNWLQETRVLIVPQIAVLRGQESFYDIRMLEVSNSDLKQDFTYGRITLGEYLEKEKQIYQ